MISYILYSLFSFNILSWGLLIMKKREGVGILGCLLPFGYISSSEPASICSIGLFMIYLWLYIGQAVAMLATGFSNEVYVTSFTVITIFELFFLFRISLSLQINRRLLFYGFAALTELSIVAAITTILAKDLQALNIMDFFMLVAKLVLSIAIIEKIIIDGLVEEYLPVVFIVVSFAIFCILHMFTTGFQIIAFHENFYISQLSTIFVLCFWFGGSLWLRKT